MNLGGKKQGGKSMYALGDMSSADMIAAGWPWEGSSNTDLIIAAVAGVAIVGLLAIFIGAMCARRKGLVSGSGSASKQNEMV